MRFGLSLFSVVIIFIGLIGTTNAADVENGKLVFKRCIACHYADKSENKVGPSLQGVIERQAGTLAGYRFSQPMINAGKNGLIWTRDNLVNYLHNPQAMVKGTRMASIKIKDDSEIDDLIAYLKSASGDVQK